MGKSLCIALAVSALPAFAGAQQPAPVAPSATSLDAVPVLRDWKVHPDMVKHYPQRALEKGITGGAVLECQVTATGKLTSCVALAETPAGYGFGKAGVAAARSARIAVAKGEEASRGEKRPVAGGKIRFRLIWTVR